MTTFTIFAEPTDGNIRSSSAVYATARAGSGTLGVDTPYPAIIAGQSLVGSYYIWEGFIDFNTSVIGSGAAVTDATLSLYGADLKEDSAFTVEAYARDWGSSLTTGDFVAGASIGGLTLVASIASSSVSLSDYSALTSQAAFLSEVNVTGNTRLMVSSSRHRTNNAPTGEEYAIFYNSDEPGTTLDPKLVVVAALPVEGALSQSIGSFSLSAAAKVQVKGALSQSIGNFTLGATLFTANSGEIQVKHNGAWQVPEVWVKHNGTWKQPVAGYVNDGGAWKRVV